MIDFRAGLLGALCLSLIFPDPVTAQTPRQPSAGTAARPAGARGSQSTPQRTGVIQDIKVEGNQRIEAGTIRSYMLVAPGDPFDPDRLDRSLKALYATGLFQDVSLVRQGDTLVVKVAENPIINRIAFEGNHKLTDEQLRGAIQSRPRGVFTPAQAQADRQRILDLYAKNGRYDARVDPKIIRLGQNRVDVVFEINEGAATLTSRIIFVGNHAFSESTLRDVIASREEAWWRFLSTSDEYDPERVAFDKELLRRFYLKNGYADFEVTNVTAELSPDRRSFFLTFTLNEGERYRINKVTINSTLRNLSGEQLMPDLQIGAGDWYDGDAVERSVEAITDDVQSRGRPFVEVKPRISRDKPKHTVDLVFDVSEGPRVYVERIDIQGNTRTEDKVIRREFRIAEGDALNAPAVRRSRQRLQDLGYFNNVSITPSTGSAPDRVILTTSVTEKATGELSLGGGFSTDAGLLLNVGLRERNFLGTGVTTGINGILAQRRSSVDISITDPYFLDRNLVAGAGIFYLQSNNQQIAAYSERRAGLTLSIGYEFNEHLRQSWNYTLADRDVYNVSPYASIYILDQAGWTLLSQVGQTITLDYRDSTIDPHTGYVARFGTDFAGLGGNATYIRTKLDGSYYIPLDRFTGNSDWGFAISAGIGQFFNLGVQEQIIDRFFLGGDNLRGFQAGGAGPHDAVTGDSLGGRFIWTQSTELRFPLPISRDIGLSGRAFVDIGSLTEGNFESGRCVGTPFTEALYALYHVFVPPGVCPPIADNSGFLPRVGAGVGVSWQTPFGLINVDLTPLVHTQPHDQKQLFRFGFGTRF
ncbi:MAG: outer membrane protein assembly factor BamA [Acetobacteraceae bacterium]|nr:outer membrane protein assembly factor BamA [Acetobacteraceae bacterium]MBV8591775.1 outer membrane protein assembly factor BamA [Acetobacteraceae bacterium]